MILSEESGQQKEKLEWFYDNCVGNRATSEGFGTWAYGLYNLIFGRK